MRNLPVAKLAFYSSCLLLVFVAGFGVRHYRVFPYSLIKGGINSVRQVYGERETLTGKRPLNLTSPSKRPGRGVTRNRQGETAPGLTFVTGFFDGHHEMRLLRLDGSVVHSWRARYFETFPNQDHVERDQLPKTEWNFALHGSLVLPDGSVVFNFEGLGTAKLNLCGEVQWTLPIMTHHSVEPSPDGGFWVPGMDIVTKSSPFPLLKPPYTHDKILKVSPDGKVLKEISTLNLFFKNDLLGVLLSNSMTRAKLSSRDITHLNDIEELDARMARSFPQFRPGDLLVSLRNLNLVLVLDPETEVVKWHQTGPWLKQHDPDFLPSGKISVVNNNDDGTDEGSILGGSRILEVDPATGDTADRYGSMPGQKWYTFRRGKHQYLPNGNVLITDSESGRVIEVNKQGEIVWEFINRFDDQYVAILSGAIRYEEDYFKVKDWSCGTIVRDTPAKSEE